MNRLSSNKAGRYLLNQTMLRESREAKAALEGQLVTLKKKKNLADTFYCFGGTSFMMIPIGFSYGESVPSFYQPLCYLFSLGLTSLALGTLPFSRRASLELGRKVQQTREKIDENKQRLVTLHGDRVFKRNLSLDLKHMRLSTLPDELRRKALTGTALTQDEKKACFEASQQYFAAKRQDQTEKNRNIVRSLPYAYTKAEWPLLNRTAKRLDEQLEKPDRDSAETFDKAEALLAAAGLVLDPKKALARDLWRFLQRSDRFLKRLSRHNQPLPPL